MSSGPKPALRLDWCSHKAAKFAVENWHYSGTMPMGKVVRVGVWEGGVFSGCVLFSRGATPHIGGPYGLQQTEVAELTRVALREHTWPVSRSLALALKMLARTSPGLRLVVSYADVDQDHVGAIYQATNWVYVGLKNANSRGAFIVNGKQLHPRSVGQMGGIQSLEWVRANLDPRATVHITAGKHKYLYPLDNETRQRIASLAKPYPKRSASEGEETSRPATSREEGGASPTLTLQHSTEDA